MWPDLLASFLLESRYYEYCFVKNSTDFMTAREDLKFVKIIVGGKFREVATYFM